MPDEANSMPNLEWGKRTYIMGIINVTPDSFSGDGIIKDGNVIAAAMNKAQEFVRDGADILDIGAESSRPGSERILAEEELHRILPVVKRITSSVSSVYICIDTYKSETALACLKAGAHWINDIWGLRADPDLAHVVADFDGTVILMHNRSRQEEVLELGVLGRSYVGTNYHDLIGDITSELKQSIEIALRAGIQEDRIIIDPGIGFGKTLRQNLELINHLNAFRELGFPILIGPSRKSFIGTTLNLPVEDREEGTAATVAVGITRGADIIRVHNVKMMARVAAMTDAIIRNKQEIM